MEEAAQNTSGGRDEQGRWKPGVSGNPEGAKPWPEEKKLARRAMKEIVAEYKENLANALPQIEPVIIERAKKGDMAAIKEIHDRVMDKARQPSDIDVKGVLEIKFDSVFNKDAETTQSTGEGNPV